PLWTPAVMLSRLLKVIYMYKRHYGQWGLFALLLLADQWMKGWIGQQSGDLHITVIDDEAWYWPTFNVAGSCLSVAVVLLLLDSFRAHQRTDAPAS
ncbi:MAG: hypothetical protein Q9M31_07400, partial [Mariprofundus sp.]|nr:hypothetical protein [Mariprofundus sp.]